MNKKLVYFGASVGGFIGGGIGAVIDGSGFGAWSVIIGMVGGLAGIYISYKAQQ